MIKKSAIL